MKDEDWERVTNTAIGIGPLTDKEVSSVAPFVGVILIIFVIGLIIYNIFK
jgi:hypothetical protein